MNDFTFKNNATIFSYVTDEKYNKTKLLHSQLPNEDIERWYYYFDRLILSRV